MNDFWDGGDLMPLWVGLALSALLGYPIFRLLIKLNSRQTISDYAPETHQAKQGTPTMGGLMFVIPFVLGAILLGLHQTGPRLITGAIIDGTNVDGYPHSLASWWCPLSLLFLAYAIIGFIDDFVVPRIWPGKRGLGWKQKLGMQFLVALVYSLIVTARSGQGGINAAQVAFDVLAILACSNAYNFADGLDGLASSIGLLLIPGLIVANSLVGRGDLAIFLELLGGAMLPFAYLNAPKAKVFMGDVGSLAVGALLGASFAVPIDELVGKPSTYWFGLGLLSLVLVAELVPVPLQILWVKLFKKRLFPFTPIHHAFEKAGWPETRVVALFASVQLLCTLGCVTLVQQTDHFWRIRG